MNKSTSSSLLSKAITIGLAVWFLVIVLDYLFHHPYFGEAIAGFNYSGLLFLLVSIMGASWFSFFRLPAEGKKPTGIKISGLGLYAMLLLMMVVVYGYYNFTNDLFTGNPFSHLIYFVSQIGALHLLLFCFFVLCFGLGEPLMTGLRNNFNSASYHLISLALGLSLLGIIGVVLGMFNLLKPGVLWPVLLVVVILRYKELLVFLEVLLLKPMEMRFGWAGLAIASVLLIFIAVNGVGAIKSFPIGFDGSNVYLNITKLIGEYQALPEGGQAFNWSVIMSYGQLLFGSTSVAILLAHLPGILCTIAIFRVAKIFVAADKALLAAAIFYTAPYISFHNLTDEKVDLGFLFISLCSLLLLLEFRNPAKDQEESKPEVGKIKLGGFSISSTVYMWILVGWLTGFAFGIKYIALINFIALIAYLFYIKAGRFAFAGLVLSATGFIFLLGLDRFSGISMQGASPMMVALIFLLPGLILLGLAFAKNLDVLPKILVPVVFFGLFFSLAYAPWVVKNISEHQSFSISNMIEGKSPSPRIIINPELINQKESSGFKSLGYLNQPPKKIIDSEIVASKLCSWQDREQLKDSPKPMLVYQKKEKKLNAAEQARREELQRYIGFESGLPLYLSLPYDLTMNTNFPGKTYLDFGFLFLLLLPLIFFVGNREYQKQNIALLIFFEVLFLLAIGTTYGGLDGFDYAIASQEVKDLIANQPSIFAKPFGAIYLGLMSLLLMITSLVAPLVTLLSGMNLIGVLIGLVLMTGFLYWAASGRLKNMSKEIKAFCSFLIAFLFIWLLLGNGIPWYAFPALPLLPVLMVYYFDQPERLFGVQQKQTVTYFMSAAFGLYFVLNLFLHFSLPGGGANNHRFLHTPFMQFAGEKMTKQETLGKFNAFYPQAIDLINQHPESNVFRVGTYLSYHIFNNDRRVFENNQLGFYGRVMNQVRYPDNFLRILKENGFRFILYDLNSASIDKTPDKSLTKKNQEFINLLLNSDYSRLILTDNIVEDPNGGKVQVGEVTVNGKTSLIGNTLYRGTFALFEID